MTNEIVLNEESKILDGRYEIVAELGGGSQGRTSLALDLETNTRVVLKELNFGHLDTIKALDLFERESRVLKSISHPAIPAYRDEFHIPAPDGQITRYFLVQEYIEGENLRDVVHEGKLFDEAGVRHFLGELLPILDYLHTREPPIIHRDIKPSNIMMRPGGDTFALIDFGAVQQKIIAASGSSTIVGTSGYMPREQLMGRTVPASDLYALGASAVYLLSHTSPSEMLSDEMTLDFRSFVNISDPFADYLARLLAISPEERFQSAREALSCLENPGQLPALRHGDLISLRDTRASEHAFKTNALGRQLTSLKWQIKGVKDALSAASPLVTFLVILSMFVWGLLIVGL